MFCKTNVTIGIHFIIVDCDYVFVCVRIVQCDDVLFPNATSLESTYVILVTGFVTWTDCSTAVANEYVLKLCLNVAPSVTDCRSDRGI
jgi:hypothetical protein